MGASGAGLDGVAVIGVLEFVAVVDGEWDSLTLSTANGELQPPARRKEMGRIEPVKRRMDRGSRNCP